MFLLSILIVQTLKRNVNDYFEINSKQTDKMAKKRVTVKFKNYPKIIKSTFKIYANLEVFYYQKNNGKQNQDGSYTNKYQNQCWLQFSYKICN